MGFRSDFVKNFTLTVQRRKGCNSTAAPEGSYRDCTFTRSAADLYFACRPTLPSSPIASCMSIKSDRWITRMAREHGMIEPFEDRQVRRMRGRSSPTA